MEIAIQFTLFGGLLLAAVVGNGLLFLVFFRNRTLRTVHHALITDLATVDLLNSVINIPLSICYIVLSYDISRGKSFAWTVSFLHTFFNLVSLSTVTLQMIERYLAISWPIFYKAKKSMTKIMVVISVKWLAILAIALSVFVPLYDIDIGNSTTSDYRNVYTRKSGQTIPKYVAPCFVMMILIFGGLSLRNLKKRPGQVEDIAQNSENSASVKARKKAVYTILILFSISLAAYLPAVIKTVVWFGLKDQARQWLFFVIMFMLSVPSAVNPYIALFRVKKYTDKLTLLVNSVKAICSNDHQEEDDDDDENFASQTVQEMENTVEHSP